MKRKFFALTPVAFACKFALAQTLPTGGHITQGQGSISSGGNTMVVTQSSQRLIADWQSFSIGKGDTVQFVQPSADAVALNRVVGADPSLIFGNLSANGRVYLQNPNGVLFAPAAQVNVGSLVATTLQADTTQFMAGTLNLSGGAGAVSVSNEGTINIAPGGYAVLAGRRVNNAGTITVPGGSIALAAGSEVTVDPTGAGVVTISVPAAAVGAQLVNSGALVADGGRITLQAAAVNAAAGRVLQVDGMVRARSIEQHGGEIILSGGASGTVAVGGQLDVSGDGVEGGQVKVLGERVLLEGTAQIDAGGAGGGRVLVGGDLHGRGSDPNALVTTVADGARIDAGSRGRGSGGNVVVWSDDVTTYAGSISARGGAAGGDGGYVEVSGKQLLRFSGQVDTSAPAGKVGTLLLDPQDLYIGPVANVDGTPGDDLTGTVINYGDYGSSESYITAAQVARLLATSDLTLQAVSSVTVSAPVTVAPGGVSSTLTLNGYFVNVNAPMALNNSALNIDTQSTMSDAIRINAVVQSLRSVAMTSTDIGIAANITTPSLTLSTQPGSDFGGISQTAGVISANNVTVVAPQGLVSLPSAGNSVDVLDVTAGQATVTVGSTISSRPLATGATVSGDYTLTVGGGVVQSRSMSIGGLFNVTTGGDAAFANAGNDFQGAVRFNVGGSLVLNDAGDLNAGGVAGTGITISAGGLFTLGADISSTSTSNPSVMEISGAGFDNGANALLNVQPRGRFIIRSSDFERDVIGAIGFSADNPASINYTVLSGWSGPDPTTGNGYYTNRTGALNAPNADRPPISVEYDRTAGFDFRQSGNPAQALLENGVSGGTALTHYTVTSTGAFADPNAGTDKSYTVAGTNDVVATVAGDGSTLYGLSYASFTRPAGVVGPDGPGNAVSEITPRPVVANGVEGVNRVYDGTTSVMLNIGGATLSGVLAGDDVGLAAGNPVGTMANKNAGIDKPVTSDGALLLSGPQAGNYSLTDESAPTVTITARGVVPTGIGTVNRYANGTTSVDLTTAEATATGIVAGDMVQVDASHALGSVATPVAGNDKPTTVTGLTLTGVDGGNYLIVSQPVNANGSGLTVDIFPAPVTSPPTPIVSDPAEPFRQLYWSSWRGARPADVELEVGALALPARVPRVASNEPCASAQVPASERAADTRSYFFYFPYRSATIDEGRSAAEERELLRTLEEGFRVERVRGFTSPEGSRSAWYRFEGNDELSHRRALAAMARLQALCAERGEDCVRDSVAAEAGSELHSLVESNPGDQPREVEGERLAEYAAAAFGTDESDVHQRTPEIQRELAQARTSGEKVQVVFPQLRRAQVDLTRRREVAQASILVESVAHSGASCQHDMSTAQTE